MSSPNQINPIRPPVRSGETETTKSRPSGLPRADKNFKKVLNDVSGDPDEKIADADELDPDDQTPTLFDISKTAKKPIAQPKQPLAKPLLKSMVKPDISQYADLPDEDENPVQMSVKTPTTTKPLIAKNPLPDEGEMKTDTEGLLAERNEGEGKIEDQTTNKPFVTTEKQSKVDDNFSLNEAGRQTTAMNTSKKTKDRDLSLDNTFVVGPKKEKPKVNAKLTGVGQENPNQDLSSFKQADIAFNNEKPQIEEEAAPRATMRELAARIIEKIQTMRTEGKTDTIVTLRSPPMLEGATVTLSALDGAKREFSISFANLSDTAKLFLDRRLADDNLVQILERKGIIVNSMRTTTLPELPLATDTDNRFDRDQQQREQQQQKRQNQTFDAEDTA